MTTMANHFEPLGPENALAPDKVHTFIDGHVE